MVCLQIARYNVGQTMTFNQCRIGVTVRAHCHNLARIAGFVHSSCNVRVEVAGKVFIRVAHNTPADSALGDTGPNLLEQRNRPEKWYVVTILAAGIIISITSRRAVGGGQCVNAAFEMLAYLGMCKNDFACRLLDVTATQAINRFCVIMWNLLDVSVTSFAADARMGPSVKECFIHIKQAIVTILVHTGKTSEAMTHEAVL